MTEKSDMSRYDLSLVLLLKQKMNKRNFKKLDN